jgi:hypothetical protein
MEHIKINNGSRVKGCAVTDSDNDNYIIFQKCTKDQFLSHILENKHLRNKHCKIKGDDVVLSNMYTALRGIYYGNYPYLALFGKREDFNGNLSLFNFVKQLAQLRLPLILNTLAHAEQHDDLSPKTMLLVLYNLCYIEHALQHGLPNTVMSMPGMFTNDKQKQLYRDLMHLRVNNRDRVTDDLAESMREYRDRMLQLIKEKLPVQPRRDIETIICNHLLNKTPLYIPKM